MVSELRKTSRANPGLAAWRDATDRRDTCTSVLVLAEIRRGIGLLARRDPAQAALFETWYLTIRAGFEDRILGVDEPTAILWANISIPDPLPRFDSLIAATALVHGLTVVTRNVGDFERIGVPVLNPFE